LLGTPEGKTPLHLAFVTRALLKHGDIEQAQSCLAELQQCEPNTSRTVALQALVSHAAGKTPEAIRIVEALAARQDADLALVASLLEELGQAAAADDVLKRLVAESGQPAAVLLRAEFLGRQQRLREALALCEEAWKTCPAEQVASVCVALLHSKAAVATDYLQVAQRLRAALAKSPKSARLGLALAEALDLQGKYLEAMSFYSRVLEIDDRNVMALNNLAWLLAQQDGSGDEALTLVNRAIHQQGPVAALLDTRALVYLKMGRKMAALTDLKLATAQQPTASNFLHLAQAELLCDDPEAAKEALQRAKAAHLTPQNLHPLERNAYYLLLEKLAVN
jgi:cellulose synthase operon protein C